MEAREIFEKIIRELRSKESNPLIKLYSDKEIQDGTATRKIKEYLGYLRSLETLALQFSNKPRTLETVVSEHKYTDIDLSTNPAEFYKQQLETARKIYPSNPLVKEYSEEEIKSGEAARQLKDWQDVKDLNARFEKIYTRTIMPYHASVYVAEMGLVILANKKAKHELAQIVAEQTSGKK